MKTPKTPVEFDYDLWKTEDGRLMVRVKATGEECEVNAEVMRLLRAEEKKVRRHISETTITEEDGTVKSKILSIDSLPSDEMNESSWLADQSDFTKEVILETVEKEFRSQLTAAQREIYETVLLGGMKPYDYAKAKGISPSSVSQHIRAIQKRAKKFF